MEEAKKKKPTYEELEQKASEVFMANQKMQQYLEKANQHIEQLEKALEDKEFNTTSFFISMLFKVMDHSDKYEPEFVQWCKQNIEGALISFADEQAKNAEAEKKEEDESK